MRAALSCHKKMMIFALILAAIYLIGLVALAGGVFRAPEGFEDEHGFQEGRDSVQEENAL
jgi:hypothetical protein